MTDRVLESWEFADPSIVAERREAQANVAARKAAANQPRLIRHKQRRIRALVALAKKGKQ